MGVSRGTGIGAAKPGAERSEAIIKHFKTGIN
jgi:hypothetical protein